MPATAGCTRTSRSPLRGLLRPSKRSRGSSPSHVLGAMSAMSQSSPALQTSMHTSSPPPPLPSQPSSQSPPESPVSATLNMQYQSLELLGPARRGGSKPKLPQFLNISPEEIDQRFQDILWQERHRLHNSAIAPTGRWARVTGSHLRVLDRYPNIQPWDRNRVRLRVPPGRVDYINASPIVLTTTAPAQAARPPDRYIAMQGPKKSSVSHVWRMVYEQLRSPAVIVMLTETHEGVMEKCYPYYPQHPDDPPMLLNEHDEFGDGFHASVRCDAIESLLGGAIEQRRILLRVHRQVTQTVPAKNGSAAGETSTTATATTTTTTTVDYEHYEDERVVYHFLYKRWPDFGVPALADVDSFFALMRLSAEKNADADNPRIVHCSAGVGRSGTFIALEHLLRELDAGVLENYDESVAAGGGAAEEAKETKETKEAEATDEAKEAKEAEEEAKDRNGMDVQEWVPSTPSTPSTPTTGMATPSPERGSGTFGDALAAAAMAAAEADDLIFTTVNQLREQRRTMVQAESQYHFIYQVMRKMWLDKYGAGGSRIVETGPGTTMTATETYEDTTASEPAPKRLEVDPFVA